MSEQDPTEAEVRGHRAVALEMATDQLRARCEELDPAIDWSAIVEDLSLNVEVLIDDALCLDVDRIERMARNVTGVKSKPSRRHGPYTDAELRRIYQRSRGF